MELILASSSPRRRMLLEEAGILFRSIAPDVCEDSQETRPELPPHELAKWNARLKAEAVAFDHPGSVVLAADTLVCCQGMVLGKPSDRTHAEKMLALLSGSTHEVITAVIWLNPGANAVKEYIGRTWVTFKPLTRDQIREYLDQVHVLDKAGAYALQERGEDIIERIEGSRSNVIGLPMEPVRRWWAQDYQSTN
ncbi:MAG: Maf family protein [Candidatus Methylacidiphilales bacterium]